MSGKALYSSKWFTVERVKGGYGVFDRGIQQGATDRAHSSAQDRLEMLERKAGMKTRRCITCQAQFHSEGAHNRMCQKCRTRATHDMAVI